MKIQNRGDVQVVLDARFKQPYPVLKDKVSLDGTEFSMAFQANEVALTIDGKQYTGGVYYLLDEETLNDRD